MRFLTEEEVTAPVARTNARISGPSAAVLEARRRMNHARRERDRAARSIGPLLGIVRRNVPVLYAALQAYTAALKGEAAAYRQYAHALAADLAEMERR